MHQPVPFRTHTIIVDGYPVECVTIGAVANAICRSKVQATRLLHGGYLPAPPYRGRLVFDRQVTALWPISIVGAIEVAAQELGLDYHNARQGDWAKLARRVRELTIHIQPWAPPENERRERPERPLPRWADQRDRPPEHGNYPLPGGGWSVDFSRRVG